MNEQLDAMAWEWLLAQHTLAAPNYADWACGLWFGPDNTENTWATYGSQHPTFIDVLERRGRKAVAWVIAKPHMAASAHQVIEQVEKDIAWLLYGGVYNG